MIIGGFIPSNCSNIFDGSPSLLRRLASILVSHGINLFVDRRYKQTVAQSTDHMVMTW